MKITRHDDNTTEFDFEGVYMLTKNKGAISIYGVTTEEHEKINIINLHSSSICNAMDLRDKLKSLWIVFKWLFRD
jgi:hypothetical protein